MAGILGLGWGLAVWASSLTPGHWRPWRTVATWYLWRSLEDSRPSAE